MLDLVFGCPKPVIGVVHLLPLPGSPRWAGDLERVLERARQDAAALASGGVNGIIVENFGDAPFLRHRAEAHTVAAMTVAAREVQRVADLPLGINVLRNDGVSALAIACATGARFLRVNVLTGAVVADEGLVQGCAAELLRYRRELGAGALVFADILVKHAAPLGDRDVRRAARAAVERGLADAIIVSGPATGEEASLEEVAAAREAVPGVPVLVGSGITEANARQFLSVADGAIVGTGLKRDGVVSNPVDTERATRLVQVVDGLRRGLPSARP